MFHRIRRLTGICTIVKEHVLSRMFRNHVGTFSGSHDVSSKECTVETAMLNTATPMVCVRDSSDMGSSESSARPFTVAS